MLRNTQPILVAVLHVLIWAGCGMGAEPTPSLEIRLIKPEQQLAELLKLFEGTKAASPAEALSIWKRADKTRTLGKPMEALIASFNPAMVGEVKNLDDATILYDLSSGKLNWWVTIPHDDGAFAAVGPALALTDGGPEPPLDGATIHRLGPDGGPLMAQRGPLVAIAMDRTLLANGLKPRTLNPAPLSSGWLIRAQPMSVATNAPAAIKPWTDAFKAIGASLVEVDATLKQGRIQLDVTTTLDPPPQGPRPAIGITWLDFVPEVDVAAAFAIALDATPEGRDRAFALFDKVERTIPDRAGIAPARVRLNVLAAALGVNLETNLWLDLIGVSGYANSSETGVPEDGLLALHFQSEPGAVRGLGLVNTLGKGLTLAVQRVGNSVWIAPKKATLTRGLVFTKQPTRRLTGKLGPQPLERFVAMWPGHWPGSTREFIPRDSSPIIWTGVSTPTGLSDRAQWDGARAVVQRVLTRSLGD